MVLCMSTSTVFAPSGINSVPSPYADYSREEIIRCLRIQDSSLRCMSHIAKKLGMQEAVKKMQLERLQAGKKADCVMPYLPLPPAAKSSFAGCKRNVLIDQLITTKKKIKEFSKKCAALKNQIAIIDKKIDALQKPKAKHPPFGIIEEIGAFTVFPEEQVKAAEEASKKYAKEQAIVEEMTNQTVNLAIGNVLKTVPAEKLREGIFILFEPNVSGSFRHKLALSLSDRKVANFPTSKLNVLMINAKFACDPLEMLFVQLLGRNT